jgi:hypothetical protein
MSRSTVTTRSRAPVETSPRAQPKFCLLECRDTDNSPREANGNDGLCSVCRRRSKLGRERGLKWLGRRHAHLRCWIGGVELELTTRKITKEATHHAKGHPINGAAT